MSFNKKHIASLVVALILIWTFNFIYSMTYRLDKPLFLNHFVELSKGDFFYLNFVQDKYAKNKIEYIKIPGLENKIYFDAFTDESLQPFPIEDCLRYQDNYYNYYSVLIQYGDEINEIKNNKTINKIIYGLNNGEEYEADIGEIIIRNKDIDIINNDILESISSFASSDGTKGQTYKINKEVLFQGVKTKDKNNLLDEYSFKINNKLISETSFPIILKKDDQLELETLFKESKSDKGTFHKFYLELVFRDFSGNIYNIGVSVYPKTSLSNKWEFTPKDIKNFINLRGMKNGQTL